MLHLDRVSSGYHMIEVIHQVDLEVAAGDRLALVGLNGAGKTTLLETIAGFVRATGGDIRFQGRSIMGLRSEDRAKLGIALVTERRNLFPDLTAWENLRLGRCAMAGPDRWKPEKVEEAKERVYTLFPKLAVLHNRPVSVMSGGEQQMVAVGRALMSEPSLLMLDEPSQGLAPKLVEAMYEAIQAIASDMTVLIVEQDLELVKSVADKLFLMQGGHVRPLGHEELEDEELMRREIFGAH